MNNDEDIKGLRKLVISLVAIVLLILVVFFGSATKVIGQERTEETCISAGEVVKEITLAKENGLTAEYAFLFLLRIGVPSPLADAMTKYIYLIYRDMTPDEIFSQFMSDCLGQPL